jgi:MFS family permease
MTSAVILGMIVTMFPDAREQARAIGVFAFVASAGGAVGLLVGGVLTQAVSWHWIFFVNIPIGIVTAVAARRLLPKDEGIAKGGGVDVPGAVLITTGLMLAVYTIVKPAAEDGWTSGGALAFGGGAVALLAAFVAREATASNPLIPLRIFRSRNVTGANLIQIMTVAGMFGMFFLGALYLQKVLHYDALKTGLAFVPTTVLMGALSLQFSERLATRFGARATLLPGLVFVFGGLALLARVPVHGAYLTDVLPTMILMGIGAGVAFPALMMLAMSDSTADDAGLASGLVNTTAQIGGALGLAVLATLSTTRTEHLTAGGSSEDAALVGGYRLAFLVAAGLLVLAVVIALTVLRPQPRTADDVEIVPQPSTRSEPAGRSEAAGPSEAADDDSPEQSEPSTEESVGVEAV